MITSYRKINTGRNLLIARGWQHGRAWFHCVQGNRLALPAFNHKE